MGRAVTPASAEPGPVFLNKESEDRTEAREQRETDGVSPSPGLIRRGRENVHPRYANYCPPSPPLQTISSPSPSSSSTCPPFFSLIPSLSLSYYLPSLSLSFSLAIFLLCPPPFLTYPRTYLPSYQTIHSTYLQYFTTYITNWS